MQRGPAPEDERPGSRYYHVVERRRSCRFSAAEADDADEQEPCAGQEPTQTSRSPSKSARSQRSATSSAADEAQQRRTQPARPAAASIRCCEAKVVKLKVIGTHKRSVADEPMSRTLLKPAQRYQLSRGRSTAATSSSQHTVLRSKGSQLTQAEVID